MPILHSPLSPTKILENFCSPMFFIFFSFGLYSAILSILTGSLTVTHVLFPVFYVYSKLNIKIFKVRIHVCETTYGTILSTVCSLLWVWPAGRRCPMMPLRLPTSSYLDANSVPRDGFYAWYCESSQSPLVEGLQTLGVIFQSLFWKTVMMTNYTLNIYVYTHGFMLLSILFNFLQ